MSDNEELEYTKPGFVEQRMAQYHEHVKQLAEAAWESCDGCDENDKYFWIAGFIAGFNNNDNNDNI
jgi:hypothetical protein